MYATYIDHSAKSLKNKLNNIFKFITKSNKCKFKIQYEVSGESFNPDGFIEKYDESGNRIWSTLVGTNSFDGISHIERGYEDIVHSFSELGAKLEYN